jgi:HSP20 family protein
MLTLTNRTPKHDVAPQESELWDPFRLMREIVGWDPLQEAAARAPYAVYAPAFEVKETADSYVFRADLPGVREEDLEISLTGNRLTIAGKREQEKREGNERFYAHERAFGGFSRSFTLPDGCDADHVTADLKGGVLTLVVTKRPEVQPRRISIGTKTKA